MTILEKVLLLREQLKASQAEVAALKAQLTAKE